MLHVSVCYIFLLNYEHIPLHKYKISMCLSRNSIYFVFTFKSIFHFELMFYNGAEYEVFFSYSSLVVPAPFFKDDSSFPLTYQITFAA